MISRYLFAKAAKFNIPLSGTFELSPCCNMDCKMCYVKKSLQEVKLRGGEIIPDKWLELAQQCKEEGMLFLLLTGGEPFLYKGFTELYEKLHKMGFSISINTNATLIDDNTVNMLAKYPPAKMNVTLYGGCDDTYRRLCNNPKGYTQVVNAVKKLLDAKITVKLNSSITSYNIQDLELIYQTAQELGVYVQATPYMFPPIRRIETMFGTNDRLTPSQAGNCQVKINKLSMGDESFINVAKSLANHEKNFEFEDTDQCSRDLSEPLGCRAGKSTFWVNWKGEMLPCGMMDIPVAYPFKYGFKKAWEETLVNTSKIFMPPQCTQCKNRNICCVCGASVYTETGGFKNRPQYVCQMTQQIAQEMSNEYNLYTAQNKN